MKKEEVNFDSENYVDFLRKTQELYQYQPSYATHAFTDIKSFSGKSVLLNTFTNLLEGSSSGMFEETDTATKPILLKSTDGKIPFWRIGEDFSMSSGCKDKALAWEFIKFCIGQKQFEFEDANSDSYYRNFFTYGSMLNKENTRQLVAYQLENDDDTAEKWEAYNEKVSAKAFRDLQLDSILTEIRNECMEQKITPEECAKLFQQRAELYVNE